MANKSLVTGKTWAEMTDAERYAHATVRGNTKFTSKFDDDSDVARQGMQWLQQNNWMDQNKQQAVRDEAIDRISSGAGGNVSLQDAITRAGYNNYTSYQQNQNQEQKQEQSGECTQCCAQLQRGAVLRAL